METQELLDKWIINSINYYLTKTNQMAKTTEERIEMLEAAHTRIFNLFNNHLKDQDKEKAAQQQTIESLLQKIDELKQTIQQINPVEQDGPLPDEMQANVEYKATIQTILSTKQVKWQNMDYANWTIKLIGKDDYAYVAFIPAEVVLLPGDKVRFTYNHPFQLKKLKKI